MTKAKKKGFSLKKKFTFNQDACLNGVKFVFREDDDGNPDVYILVARWKNKEHERFLRKWVEKNTKRLKHDLVGDDEATKKEKESMARHVIKDMVGFEEIKGPYTWEQGYALLIDVDDSFFLSIKEFAQEDDAFRIHEEAMEKNSETTPVGSTG